MKILFDHQIFYMQQYGGISRYFYEIANRIAEAEGNKVEIFAPLYVNEYFRNDCMVRPQGIKIPLLPRSGRVMAAVNTAISQLRVRSRGDVDIYHETYYSMADCCPRKAKRVITVYDMIHEKFAESFPQRDRTREIKAHAIRRADHVICISENTRRDLIELVGIPEEKTSVVYLGYSLAMGGDATKPVVGEKPYILYVGQRGWYKNFESLMRAYASSALLKNGFSLVCFGGGAFTARERALMESLKITSSQVMHLSGGDDILAGLYAGAVVFVYPSLYEGFGIPPLEAMSFGCPVVCANTSSLPEVVGDSAELFNPADEADMCKALERVVTSTERANFLIERGRERCKQFSWEKCASETLDVYKRVLQG
jgi:glycosyltransferase involved in cell wall biosynthesis